MQKFAVTGLAALMAFSALIPAVNSSAEARRGRNTAIAAGVILGVAAAAALSSRPARASNSYNQRTKWERYCYDLYRRCDNGSNYACRKYETNGCTE